MDSIRSVSESQRRGGAFLPEDGLIKKNPIQQKMRSFSIMTPSNYVQTNEQMPDTKTSRQISDDATKL